MPDRKNLAHRKKVGNAKNITSPSDSNALKEKDLLKKSYVVAFVDGLAYVRDVNMENSNIFISAEKVGL